MFASTTGAGARLGLRRLSTQRRNFPIQSVHMRFALRFERILELNLFLLELTPTVALERAEEERGGRETTAPAPTCARAR